MKICKAVCYSLSLSDQDVLAHVRLLAPLKQSNIKIIPGIENQHVFPERVHDGDVVILQREFPKDLPSYEKIREIARSAGKPVIFDLDDQLFFLPKDHPDRRIGKYGDTLLPMFQALVEADLVSVSTSALENFVKQYNQRVALLPNFLDDDVWRFNSVNLKTSPEEEIIIGYMGGITHKPDLAYLIPVLLTLLERYRDKIRLKFFGIQPPDVINSLKQVEYFPPITSTYHEFASYFQRQTVDIFIAPLQDTQFNTCKSPIKFFEYTALGTPGVYSRLDTYTKVIEHGLNGFLARTHEEWLDCLIELIEDPTLRFHLARNAQKIVRSKWLLSNNAHIWPEAYAETLDAITLAKKDIAGSPGIFSSINNQLYENHEKVANNLEKATSKMAEYENTILILQSRLEESKQDLLVQNTQISEKEQEIHGLLLQVNQQEQEIQELITKYGEKESEIQELTTTNSEKEREIQNLSQVITDLKRQSQVYYDRLVQKERVAQAKSRQLTKSRSKLEILNGKVAQQDGEIKDLLREVEYQEDQIQELSHMVDQQKQELSEILGSKAWKVGLFVRRLRILIANPNSFHVRLLQRVFGYSRVDNTTAEEIALIKSSGFFDEKWYLSHNPDIVKSKIDPVIHYLRHGGFEGRDPSPNFSSDWYLTASPDVVNAKINPLVHYLQYGRHEGRSALPTQTWDNTPLIELQPAENLSMLEKIIRAWEEGGIGLVWHKICLKIKWVINREYLKSAQTHYALLTETNQSELYNLDDLSFQPMISVLIPSYNTPVKYLKATINSVRDQYYPNWEICLFDDGSSNKKTKRYLGKIAKEDKRIKVVFSPQNQGISAATNQAAEIAEGQYLAFLDHDDELTPNALFEMVMALNEDDQYDILYSDQDKIDASNRPHEPFFKPDWSPYYLRSVMYIGHLLMVRTELFRRLQGMDSVYDGVQDYEFMLRVAENPVRVKHIPKILYHWRKIPGSVALGLDEKGEKIERLQVMAVNQHLARLGIQAEAKQYSKHRHRALILPKPRSYHPLVSLVILTKDAPHHISRCLQSIFELTSYPNYEIIVVDNGTTDPEALAILDKNPVKVVPFPEKFNFSKANNVGFRHTSGEYIVIMNNDTEVVSPDWIEQLLFYCEQPDVGIVGPLLLYPDQTVQHAGVVLGFRGTADHVMRHFPSDSDGYAGSLSCPREVTSISAACLVISRQNFLDVGGFEELYGTHYQDVDLCLRVLALGKRNLYVPYAVLFHHEGISRGKFYDHIDRALLLDIWGDMIRKGDPFYNQNFSLDNHHFYQLR